QSARTRLWHAIPLFHFLRKRPTKKNRRSLHHSAQCRKNLFATNRYPSCPAASLLPSGGLPSGLPQAPFLRALHHDQRPAETDQLEKRVPRDVPERLTFKFSSLQNPVTASRRPPPSSRFLSSLLIRTGYVPK